MVRGGIHEEACLKQTSEGRKSFPPIGSQNDELKAGRLCMLVKFDVLKRNR